MEEKKTFEEKCKESWVKHRKKVKSFAIIGVAVAATYVFAKNLDEIYRLVDCNSKMIFDSTVDTVDKSLEIGCVDFSNEILSLREVPVKAHPLNLPNGKHASEAGKNLAVQLGVVLGENQTMRRATTRHIAA